MFQNRIEAARQLAARLGAYKSQHPLILAIPRGAVPMGKIVADALDGELDVVLVHKLGAPGNPEYAIGAVSETGNIWLRDAASTYDISRDYLVRHAEKEINRLARRREMYTPDRGPKSPRGRTVIVIDDGVATGATMHAALRSIQDEGPDTVVVAVAVAPAHTLKRLRRLADEVICLEVPENFLAVGQAFREFDSVSDEDAAEMLRSAEEDVG